MNRYDFLLILEGPDATAMENAEALYASIDDAVVGSSAGVQYADFTREAPSLSEAVFLAIRQVESAVPGLRVVRVEPDELVT